MKINLAQNEDFTIVTKGGGKISVPNVVAEPQFNPTAAYAVDAKVWYGSIQYVCMTATTEPDEGKSNPTPEEDTAHWTEIPVEEMTKKSELAEFRDKLDLKVYDFMPALWDVSGSNALFSGGTYTWDGYSQWVNDNGQRAIRAKAGTSNTYQLVFDPGTAMELTVCEWKGTAVQDVPFTYSGTSYAVTVEGRGNTSLKPTGDTIAKKSDVVLKSGDEMTGQLTVSCLRVGNTNTASGINATAEGSYTTALGNYSHTEGSGTTAQNQFEHAQGRYNASHTVPNSTFGNAGNTLNSIGFGAGGSVSDSRRNAVETMQDGKTFIYGLGRYDGTNPTDAGVKDIVATIDGKKDDFTVGTGLVETSNKFFAYRGVDGTSTERELRYTIGLADVGSTVYSWNGSTMIPTGETVKTINTTIGRIYTVSLPNPPVYYDRSPIYDVARPGIIAIDEDVVAKKSDVVPTSRKVNGQSLSSDVTLAGSDIAYNTSTTVSAKLSSVDSRITAESTARANADTAIRQNISQLSSSLAGKLDKSGGTVVGTLGIASPELPEQKVFEVTPSADGSEPTMRFSDSAGVIGITWRIVDGYVVMDVSDLLGHTYRISLPAAAGTLALLQNLAGDFSSSTTYAKDALVVYSGALYHCVNTDGHTGAWADADFTPATVDDVLTSLRQGKLDTSGGTMTGKFQVGAHNDGIFHVVPEKFDQGSYIPPTMRFGDEAGVVGIIWSIDMDGVVMDVSDPYGHTYHVAMPTASGTLALTAGNGHAGNLAALDDNGNPIDSGTAASSILNQEAVENEFSELSTYAQKDYATHDGRLYRCKNTNGPGEWDPLYWENVKIKDLLDDKLGKTDTITRIANDNNTEHCDGSGNVYDVTKSGNTWYVPNSGGNQTYYGIFSGKYAWTHDGSYMTTYDPTTGIVKLYSGTTFQIPKNLNPLLGDDLSVDDENIRFTPLQAAESSAPKTKFVRFPVYNGQNQQYFDDTATDEDDPTKTYKDTGTHHWTANANCIAYFNMQGSPNQSVVRIVVNDKSEVDSTTVFTHTVYRNLNLANKCVCVPLFLNANDNVYVKIADNALSSLTISVFYI